MFLKIILIQNLIMKKKNLFLISVILYYISHLFKRLLNSSVYIIFRLIFLSTMDLLVSTATIGPLCCCDGAVAAAGEVMDGLINESELEYLDGRKDAADEEEDEDDDAVAAVTDRDVVEAESAVDVAPEKALVVEADDEAVDGFRVGCRASSGVCLSLSMKDSFFGSEVASSPV